MVARPLLAALSLLSLACGSPGGGGAGADAGDARDGGAGLDGGGDGGAPDASGRDAGLGHPFGTHGGYWPTGVIFPGNHSQADLDAATAAFYDGWKARYLEPACAAGQYRVKTHPATGPWTVSEGHGYGMLATAVMAGHDPLARAEFDGLYRYYDGHRSTGNHDLMAWAQNQACADVQGADSATDGDLDIAYALLLADRQWGSGGAIDYRAEGIRIIAAILASDVHPANTILVGDWASDPADSHHGGTRPSDFMTGHFRAFQGATGVARWGDVGDKTYAVIAALQGGFAPATGLLPDFAIDAPLASVSPAPGGWLEGPDDGHYSWNACRTPWRIATDYLMSGEPRSRTAMRAVNAWIRARTGGVPSAIRDGYGLDGTVLGSAPELAFVAPFAVSAMIEPAAGSNQAWLDALWDELAQRPPADYYGDSIKLFAMVVASGNWWSP